VFTVLAREARGGIQMTSSRPPLSRKFVLDQKRRRILTAIAELSAERGYRAMTLNEIVKRAKVGRATFYEVFTGEDEAFLAAVSDAAAALVARVEEACAAESGEWSARLSAGLAALLDHLADHPAEAYMLIVDAPRGTIASAECNEDALKRLTTSLRDVIPTIRGQPETLEETIFGGVVWILHAQIRGGGVEKLSDLTESLCKFVLTYWEHSVR